MGYKPYDSIAHGYSNPALYAYQDPTKLATTFDASNIANQQRANESRVPNSVALETQSSSDIANLLNPSALIPELGMTNAETAAARGVPGSGAGFQTGVRMTEDEQLKRMALGEQFLTAAYARNPGAHLTDPLAMLSLQDRINQENNAVTQPQARISQSGPGAGRATAATPSSGSPYPPDWWNTFGTGEGATPAPFSDPFSSPMDAPGTGLDQILGDFGLPMPASLMPGANYDYGSPSGSPSPNYSPVQDYQGADSMYA